MIWLTGSRRNRPNLVRKPLLSLRRGRRTMPNIPRGVHASAPRDDQDGFPLRTGSVANIKPLIDADWPPHDGRVLDGWVAVGAIAKSDLADPTAVISAADIIVLSRDPIDEVGLIVPVTEMPARGERVVFLEVPDQPIPAAVVEAIARHATMQK